MIEAWHFLAEDKRLRYGDWQLVEVGKTIKVDCEPVLCQQGLHASVKAIDALNYAPGPIVCRVEVGGEIVHGEDKLVGTERTVTAMADATNLLHDFACWCAEEALKKRRESGNEPDPRSWAAIEAKRKWLKGEITDEELVAARDAARDAARSAAGAAARAAAWDAAWAAARSAAGAAARSAAGAAAWDAAWAAQNIELERRLYALLEDWE